MEPSFETRAGALLRMTLVETRAGASRRITVVVGNQPGR
jgi:hypothetical protein